MRSFLQKILRSQIIKPIDYMLSSSCFSQRINFIDCRSLTNSTQYFFAKISKKKQEKLEKAKDKSDSSLPDEIDLTQYEDNYKKEVDSYKKEISKMKSGRLTPELFEQYVIVAYGQKTPVTELAQIVPKTATSIVLNVYDEHLIPEIMKQLENSDMNFEIKKVEKAITCSISGGNTKEIKESTLKAAKLLLENYKTKFRKIRSNGMDYIKPFKKHSSEDVMKQAETEVHKIFTRYSADLEKVLKDKERELFK